MTDRNKDLDELSREGLAGGFVFNLPSAQADRLLSESIRIDVPPGSVVYRVGDAARCFVVVRGLLRAFISSTDGRQVTFRYGKPGAVMGLASVIGEPPPVTIQAMTPSAVVALRVDLLRRMVETDPIVARVCAEELTRQLNSALADVAQSAFHTVRQRLARQLLDLATESDGPRLVAPVSHQELADAIASSREVVSRILHEMREERLIESGHDRLVILLDVDRLARELEAGSEPAARQARPG